MRESRCITFRGESLLAVRNGHGMHIVPGGRREPGETLEETLRRELLEETGWTVSALRLLGFLRYRDLSPEPYSPELPFPDFLQLIYTAEAVEHRPEAKLADDAEALVPEFHPLSGAEALPLNPRERFFLGEALRGRRASRG